MILKYHLIFYYLVNYCDLNDLLDRYNKSIRSIINNND